MIDPIKYMFQDLVAIGTEQSYIMTDFVFVGCNSEAAEKIYFTWQDFCANEDLHLYVSVFDRAGTLIKHFKNVDGVWTDNF